MRTLRARILLPVLSAAALSAVAGPASAKAPPQSKPRGFLEKCRADRDRFCHDVVIGQGRLLLCLKEHEEHLTGECHQLFLGDREPTKL
jgi:hypothetical protein